MSKAVFWSVPADGDTNPVLATIKELVVRGETVIYWGTEQFREKVESTGAEFRVYKGEVHSINFKLAETDMLGFLISLLRYCVDKLEYNLEDARSENPDYIIHGCLSIWGKYLGKILNLKTINLYHSAPIGKKDIVIDFDIMIGFIFPLLIYRVTRRFDRTSFASILKYKYKLSVDYFDITACKEDLNIVYSSEFMSPELVKEESGFQFVGPSLYNKDAGNDFPLDFIKDRKNILIYISLGTIHSKNIDFYKMCISAIKDKQVRAIISIGKEHSIDDFENIPKHILLQNYVPQLYVLKHAKLFITHSGMNSVNEALYYGVPMLLFPHHMEQLASANRIERLGVGIKKDIKKIDTNELSETIELLLDNPEYMKNALKYSALTQKEEQYSHELAANEILQYISS